MRVLQVNGRTSRGTARGGPPPESAHPRASAARPAQATSRRHGWPMNVTSWSSLPGARLLLQMGGRARPKLWKLDPDFRLEQQAGRSRGAAEGSGDAARRADSRHQGAGSKAGRQIIELRDERRADLLRRLD